MLLICGTVPAEDLPLTLGEASFDGEYLCMEGKSLPCTQGTAALVGAACATVASIGAQPPHVLLVGDKGTGGGSRSLYHHLIHHLPVLAPDVLMLHYMLPVMGLIRKVCESALNCPRKPVMIADAAAMYAAKAAGVAPKFDIFTPDLSEVAFLADPDAMHPAYVSRHLFESDASRIPQLAGDAYRQGNAAPIMVVKGATDYIIGDGKVLDTVSEPDLPALEAIGGTGDTLSGILCALVDIGMGHGEAAMIASVINRKAGEHVKATPSTKIRQIILAIQPVIADLMENRLNSISKRSLQYGRS